MREKKRISSSLAILFIVIIMIFSIFITFVFTKVNSQTKKNIESSKITQSDEILIHNKDSIIKSLESEINSLKSQLANSIKDTVFIEKKAPKKKETKNDSVDSKKEIEADTIVK